MKHCTLEERIARLERKLLPKNELQLFGLGKPKRSEEPAFVSKLFSKYPSISKVLNTPSDKPGNGKQVFHLVLSAKNQKLNGLGFIISTADDRKSMYITAYDDTSNSIATLKPFNLEKDINKVALFILEQIDAANKRNGIRSESRKKRFESVPLNSFDSGKLEQMVLNNLKGYDDVAVDIVDDNGDYGFLNIGIECGNEEDDYDIIANEYNSFEVVNNDKTVGKYKSMNDAVKAITDHFEKNHLADF